MNTLKHEVFLGIDISKKYLDFNILKDKCVVTKGQVANNTKGLQALKKMLTKEQVELKKILICCENTGIYTNPLLAWAHKGGYKLWVENPIEIKKSMGLVRGKNDQIDAYRIALYATRFEDKCRLYEPPRQVIKDLKTLINIRKNILKMQGQITRQLKEAKEIGDNTSYKIMAKLYKGILALQAKKRKEVDEAIKQHTQQDERLARMVKVVTSVEGVGMVTCAMMVVHSNEFQHIQDPRKMACYAGVAPFEHTSGTSIRGKTRTSMMANKPLKTVLHMAALSAAHSKGELSTYYQRKVEAGKSKMSILNAVRNKIIHRVYACIRDNRLYEMKYKKDLQIP